MFIVNAKAVKILNSRNEQTISVIIETKAGKVLASSPTGKSRGKHEVEPFSNKGIEFSLSFANAILKKLITEKISFSSFNDLEKFEALLRKYDKTKNWSIIGGNTVFAIEAAILKAIALSEKDELWHFLNPKSKILPTPIGNCIGGGSHIKSENKTDIQEFLFIPKTKHFYDAYFINLKAYREAKRLILERDKLWKGELTDERAIASTLETEKILEIMLEVSEKIKETFNIRLDIGIDIAASTLFNGKKYIYNNPKSEKTIEEQISFILNLIKKYNLFYIEDPLYEEDFENFAKLTSKIKSKTLIVADDLTCTNSERLQKAIEKKAINATIIKPNQNGSLFETKKFVDVAKKNNITTIISHRSGETMDSTIADLAVAWQIPYIKTGILGKERFAKLHKLLKIEREIGK
ncbi:MAG: enolase C-terminal domain-like protein [Candidatus Pacearchaeota archaeon]